jgi:hypothetical protein
MRIITVGAIIVFAVGLVAKDKPAEPAPTPVNIPAQFSGEIQTLAKGYTDLATQQKVLDLTRDNLQLRICAEVGIKPVECRVDWGTGKVTKVEPPKPPIETEKDTGKK